MVLMCGFHKRFPGIIIPRNLCSFTPAIEVLFMKVFNSEELICLRRGWKMMNLNLWGWTITLFALISDWFFTRIFPLPCPWEREALFPTGTVTLTWLQDLSFGLRSLFWKDKQTCKTKQNSCLRFWLGSHLSAKAFLKTAFYQTRKLKNKMFLFKTEFYYNTEMKKFFLNVG